MEEREIKVIITFAKQSEQQVHPVKLSKAIEKEIGIVKAVSCLSNGRIMIKCKDEKQKQKFLKMKTLAGGRITCTEIGNKVLGVCGNAENLCHRNHFTFTLRDWGGVSQLTAEGRRI